MESEDRGHRPCWVTLCSEMPSLRVASSNKPGSRKVPPTEPSVWATLWGTSWVTAGGHEKKAKPGTGVPVHLCMEWCAQGPGKSADSCGRAHFSMARYHTSSAN